MTTFAPITAAAPPILEWIGSDTEPSDEFVDALVELLLSAAADRLAEQPEQAAA